MLFRRRAEMIGLDVGSAAVEAALIDHSHETPRILRLASIPLPEDAIVEGEVMNSAAVVEAIAAAVAVLETRSKRVTTAIGGRDVIIRRFQMDPIESADAHEAILIEAEQHIPFDLESVQIDYHVLGRKRADSPMEVLLVAAKKMLVQDRVELVSNAGFSVAILDVDAFALFNALKVNYPASVHGRAVLINVGIEDSTIVVHEHGAPVVTRQVEFSMRRLGESLKRINEGVSRRSEEILYSEVSPTPEEDSVLIDGATDLAISVERATAFLSTESGTAVPFSEVQLTGVGIRIPHLQQVLSRRLRARVDPVSPVQRIEIAPGAIPQEIGDSTERWMLAVGLALRTGERRSFS